ncbi:hypothetical protein QN277_014508 [Acacia crassicarpa]|uniref:Uncharacterized protein n=1 Tax=Acacia crassicarpa TaxID=499986 RepID=A0AAE1M473_9FABA|nr:hypothetical protein QN277_014508 [Acacia crassicarpa]
MGIYGKGFERSSPIEEEGVATALTLLEQKMERENQLTFAFLLYKTLIRITMSFKCKRGNPGMIATG